MFTTAPFPTRMRRIGGWHRDGRARDLWSGRSALLVSAALHLGLLALLDLDALPGPGRTDSAAHGAMSVTLVPGDQGAHGDEGASRERPSATTRPLPAPRDTGRAGASTARAAAVPGESPEAMAGGGGDAAAAAGGGSGAARSAGSQDYGRRLLDHMRPFRRYPDVSGVQPTGRARVGMLIDRAGNLLEIWLQGSSGHKILDREAIDTVVRAAPMPAPPAGAGEETAVVLPIDFTRRMTERD